MRIHAITFVLLTGLAGFACAQASSASSQPPPYPMPKAQSPEEVQKMLQSSMGAMVPMMAKMSEAQVDAQLTIAERPETAERIATFKRNLFEALRRKGFTVEESVTIVSGTPLPSATGMK